jgi:hypothetical protein
MLAVALGVTRLGAAGGDVVHSEEPGVVSYGERSPHGTVVRTTYIVESQERAQQVLDGIEQANAIRRTLAEGPLAEDVVWFASVEAEVQFWAIREAVQLHDGGNGVGRLIVDLRTQAYAPTGAE